MSNARIITTAPFQIIGQFSFFLNQTSLALTKCIEKMDQHLQHQISFVKILHEMS